MRERGQTETLGYVLIFALVLSTATVVSFSGVDAIQSKEETQRVQNTERAFEIFASNMDDIQQRGAPSRATEVSLDGASLGYGDTGTVNVSVIDGGTETNHTYEIRPLVYETNEDNRLVYEAGAIFYQDDDGNGVVVRDPPFLADDGRVNIPVVATRADNAGRQLQAQTVLIRANAIDSDIAVANTSGQFDDLYVNVTSPRADLWQRYFEETDLDSCRTGRDAEGQEFVECHLDESPEQVYVTLDIVELEFE